MLLKQNIYNTEKYRSQIQKYALSTDNFNDGVYRTPKEKALLKKYIGFNNISFINGLVFGTYQKWCFLIWMEECYHFNVVHCVFPSYFFTFFENIFISVLTHSYTLTLALNYFP